jgi:hypothetical protein
VPSALYIIHTIFSIHIMHNTYNIFNTKITKIDEIIREILFIKAYSVTKDSHDDLLLLSPKCSMYHISHTNLFAVEYLWVLAGHYITYLGFSSMNHTNDICQQTSQR